LGDQWDGKARLDTWLIDYCGVEDTPYARAVAAKWLIAAARRVRSPGCKFDHVLIFEGPQGSGKSTVFRTLAYDDWFTDNLTIGLDPKQVIELTRGKWICELAELTNLGKKDVEAVKAFVTRQVDEARMAYGREVLTVHRQFVLAATTNRPRYLRDESGDRRFWMVQTKGVIDTGKDNLPLMLDVVGLRAVRDQLWGEAAVREAKGEDIHLSHEIEALARVEQAKRFDADERQQLLEDLLEGKSGFAPNDELYHAIGVTEIKDRHPGVTKLVTAALTRLGFERDKHYVGEPPEQVRGWQSPDGSKEVLVYTATTGFVAMPREGYTPRNRAAVISRLKEVIEEMRLNAVQKGG
jgi:predicted P-loop ATPase